MDCTEEATLDESILYVDDKGVWQTWRNDQDEAEWQAVSYRKRRGRYSSKSPSENDDQHSEDRRIAELTANDEATDAGGSVGTSENGSEVSGGVSENGGDAEVKRAKRRRKKKTVHGTIADSAAKINAADLRSSLLEIEGSSKGRHDAQLRHLVDVFGRFFATDGCSQFSWLNFLRETTLAKTIDVPLSHMPRDVREIVSNWVAQRKPEVLGSFILWCLDTIFSDITIHDAAATESKKPQVSIFIVLATVLREKPDVLIGLLPILSENSKYLGQDKLPVTSWMIAQASQSDVLVGLYAWVRIVLPLLDCNSSSDFWLARDLILQLVERILSSSTARCVLLNSNIRKGECIVPPSALAVLMRLAFPRSSAKVKDTVRFKAIYLALKDVVLSGSMESKIKKQVTGQLLSHALKAAGEGIRDLANEASDVSLWCLDQNPDCFRQWDKLYLDNLKGSVVLLRKLSGELTKFPAADKLFKQTLRSFTRKNKQALEKPINAAAIHEALFKDSDKYCGEILGESSKSQGRGFTKSIIAVAVVVFGVAALSLDSLHF